MDADWDVAVIGLGAMGACALWRLSRRPGVRVVGIEAYRPGHQHGSSHGESRIFRTAYMEGESYVPLMRRARLLWTELEREAGVGMLVPTGCLSIGRPDATAVAGALASARAHGLAYELLSAAALRDRFGQHAVPDDLTVAVYEPDAGFVRPELAVRSAVAAAAARGATVLTGVRVGGIEPAGGRIRVALPDGALTARHVVIAAGRWLTRLLPEFAPHVRPLRRVAGWFAARAPAEFAPARFPAFLRTTGATELTGSGRTAVHRAPGRSGRPDQTGAPTWYGVPSVDGATVKVALHQWAGLAELDELVDPGADPRPPEPADAAPLADLVARYLPGLIAEPVRMSACTYVMTPDEHFLIGPHRPGLTLLGGFSGHGFKFAPLVGELAADLALAADPSAPIPRFDPHRFD